MFRIEAVTKQPRHEAIALLSEAILQVSGDIIDSRFFSNTVCFISAEVDAERVGELRAAMARAGLHASPGSIDAAGRVSCHIAVHFVHNDPDLRIEVPSIPG